MVTRNKFFKYKIPVMALILLLACMAIPWPAVAASAPVVSGISPNSGSSDGGTSVAITGTGFGTGSDVATAVYFGSTPAVDFAVYSNTSITAVSPAAQAGDVTVDVTVYGPGGTSATSSSDQFTYIPAVSGISPNSGSSDGGTSVIISGNCFGTGSDVATAVYFGSTAAASFTVNSDTQITAVSPDVNSLDLPESTPVDITVYGPGGTSATSSSDQFTYIPAGFMGMNKLSSPLTTALQGTDTGNLIFTMGNSVYNPTGEIAPGGTATVDYTVSGIPAGATVTAARLYAYCAFSRNASDTRVNQYLSA